MKRFFLWPYGFLFLALVIQGPLFNPDSGTYISGSSMRSALYPLMLKGFYFLGDTYALYGVMIFQMGFGFYAAYYLANVLKEIFSVPEAKALVFCLMGIFLMPYYGPSHFGNLILTEGLCYPLFLIFVSYLFRFLYDEKFKYFYICLFWVALLILTRRQFLFLYPILGVVSLYVFFIQKKVKQILGLILWLCVSIGMTNLIERTYQYYNDGHFATIPFTGIQLVVAPLYVSKPQDVELFSDHRHKALFQTIHHQLDQNRLLAYKATQWRGSIWLSAFDRFKGGYNTICHGIVASALSQYQLNPYQVDQMLIQMAWVLIKANPKAYVDLLYWNILDSLGGYFYTALLLLLWIASVFHYLKMRDKLSIFLFFVGLLMMGNYTLVALVEPILRRYAIYTDIVQLSMIIICFYILFFQNKSQITARAK